MSTTTRTITRSKGGTKERKIPLDRVKVPDLWHIALCQDDSKAKEMILDCWHLAHDLLRELRER